MDNMKKYVKHWHRQGKIGLRYRYHSHEGGHKRHQHLSENLSGYGRYWTTVTMR